jgi:beta-glucosidase
MSEPTILRFPDNFIWGTATSAYQIEGALNEAGRGLSIWDTFCHTPGKIHAGETGDVAADHYHRWAEDVRLMADLGLKTYRFSIAWPRIFPAGTGAVNPAGLDFYDRLVDALLANGITPYVTLYHWDLPQALQDRGGWANRDTALHFAEYARVVAERLSDRAINWITHNEPFVAAMAGHFTGEHAPGMQDPFAALKATHHLLLSHGLAVETLRASARRPLKIGITLNLNPVHPASDSEADRQAAVRFDGILNRLFLDPVLRGRYPDDMLALFGLLMPQVTADDLTRIATPLDFLGVNYYSRTVVRYDPNVPIVEAVQIHPAGNEYSGMWEIYPPGMYELLTRIWNEYRPSMDILVTENGICVPDGVDFDGRVRDERRIRYLHKHIAQVHRAMADGVPVRGYFVWSLMDNFEWAHGYGKRFGLALRGFRNAGPDDQRQRALVRASNPGEWSQGDGK